MNNSLVQSLLDGSEESARVFIHDSAASNGRPLLKFGVRELAKRCDAVHVLLYDVSAQYWVKGLSPDIVRKLHVHDGIEALIQSANSDLFSPVAMERKIAVVIDSLSFLLLRNSPPTCTPCTPPMLCRWLMSIHSAHTLCLLHSDLHEEGVVSQLDSVATSNIQVTPSSGSKRYAGNVCTTHQKPSGKILRQTETYSVSADCAYLTTVIHTQSQPATISAVDPASNLTFDLHLSAKEKEARAQVVLPYTSAQERGQEEGEKGDQEGEGLVTITSSKSTGKIFYEPDPEDEDCFVDSDPDDDLDF